MLAHLLNTVCSLLNPLFPRLCLDLDYFAWLLWTFSPLLLACLLMPLILLVLLLGTGCFLFSWSCFRQDAFAGCRHYVARFWVLVARLWNGWEVIGWDKIPRDRGAMIVYYHGTVPYDMYYLLARLIASGGKFGEVVPVVDRFLMRVLGFKTLMAFTGAVTGSVEQLAEDLKAGKLVTLSPGGVREALFADEYYPLLWGKRCGFARAVIKANAPILPMFTENCRECIRMVQFFQDAARKLYERFRLPLGLPYGFFPVKFRTYIGDPIFPMEGESAEELARRVKQTIAKMIEKHQRRPGNILIAMLQRVPFLDAWLRPSSPH